MELIKGSKKFKKNLEEKERRSETQIHFTLRNEDGWERQTRTDWYSCSRGAHFTWGGGKNVRGVSPGFLKPLTARHLPLCPVHCTCPLLPLFFNVLFNSLYIYIIFIPIILIILRVNKSLCYLLLQCCWLHRLFFFK